GGLDDNDDDAASYHSITSSPGNVRAARTLPRDGVFAQAQAPPSAGMPGHSQGGHFASPHSRQSPAASGHAFSPATNGYAFAPAPARAAGHSPAARGRAASDKPA
ncbi:hypothetical protein IWQ56_007420, partial [Coemansia nantahalensis]